MTQHSAQASTAGALADLRNLPRPAWPEPNKPLVPQIYFSWDSEQAQVNLQLPEAPSGLLTIEAAIKGAPRWINLSIALGDADFSAGAVLGLAVRAEGTMALEPFFRSRQGDKLRDTQFGERLAIGPEGRPGVLLRKLARGEPMTEPGQYHTLILPLPAESFRLNLIDLRFFVLPAGANAEPDLPRLGSFAL